jgi:hypothetical protein
MDIKEFSSRFSSKMDQIKQFTSGNKIKDILGVEAVNHFKESFQNEGFTYKPLNS